MRVVLFLMVTKPRILRALDRRGLRVVLFLMVTKLSFFVFIRILQFESCVVSDGNQTVSVAGMES